MGRGTAAGGFEAPGRKEESREIRREFDGTWDLGLRIRRGFDDDARSVGLSQGSSERLSQAGGIRRKKNGGEIFSGDFVGEIFVGTTRRKNLDDARKIFFGLWLV